MATSNNNLLTGKISGSIGPIVFRQWFGKTIISQAPTHRRKKPTPGQLKSQERFRLASVYALSIMSNADQSLSQAYAMALKPRQNLYARIMEDFLSVPIVSSINSIDFTGTVGDKIIIRATDDFRVTGVLVEIFSANNKLLESGNAVQNFNGLDWTYTTTLANEEWEGSKIKATASDIPGNKGILEQPL